MHVNWDILILLTFSIVMSVGTREGRIKYFQVVKVPQKMVLCGPNVAGNSDK